MPSPAKGQSGRASVENAGSFHAVLAKLAAVHEQELCGLRLEITRLKCSQSPSQNDKAANSTDHADSNVTQQIPDPVNDSLEIVVKEPSYAMKMVTDSDPVSDSLESVGAKQSDGGDRRSTASLQSVGAKQSDGGDIGSMASVKSERVSVPSRRQRKTVAHDAVVKVFAEAAGDMRILDRANSRSKKSALSNFSSAESSQDEGTKQTSWYKRFEHCVLREEFEMLVSSLLLLNLLLMSVESQYEGIDAGYEIGYQFYDQSAEKAWPHAPAVFQVLGRMFAIAFTLEVLARLVVLRCKFWMMPLNYLDFVVVLGSWFELLMESAGIDPTILRSLRLAKLFRSVRVVKLSKAMDSLQLLVACIVASVSMLLWSLFLLMIIQCVAGLCLYQITQPFLRSELYGLDQRLEVFRYYGTFTNTLLTMFEILFANWAPSCRVLTDNVSEWFALFFLFYRCMIIFSVLNVVSSVFVQQTMKVALADDDIQYRAKQKAVQNYSKRLAQLFSQLDQAGTGDGKIEWEQFELLLFNDHFQFWLSQLEIEAHDLHSLFELLDDGDGAISLDEFTQGIPRLKGPAKNMDMALVMNVSRRIDQKLDLVCAALKKDEPESMDFGRTSSYCKKVTRFFEDIEAKHKST